MQKPPVLFFRGMNTYADDHLRLGFWNKGPIYLPLQKALRLRGWDLIPIEGMGSGSIEEHVDRALQFYQKLCSSWPQPQRVHLLGHSMGGVIARAFAHRLPIHSRPLSVTSFASPHNGAAAAEHFQDFHLHSPKATQLARLFGYEINHRRDFFSELLPERMTEFNSRTPDLPGVRYASVVCSLPFNQMSWPIRWTVRLGGSQKILGESDGIVEKSTQSWGEVLGEIELDHLSQLGFNTYLWPPARQRGHRAFHQLLDTFTRQWEAVVLTAQVDF